MIQVVNTTSAILAAGAMIPPGTVQARTNNRVNLNGNALEIVKPGTYKVDGNFLTWVTSAAGTLINASETVSRIV